MRKTVIGIDVGGSTTKIVGFDENGSLIEPMFVRAADPLTSLYGAFGKFTSVNELELDDIEHVMCTGVGSSFITKPIYGLNCETRKEFTCVGLGGLYLSELERCIVISMGTGTAIVYAEKGKEMEYLGGTGIGGGTLMGLSKKMLGMDNINHIVDLAQEGDLNKIDLRINDITNKDILPGLPAELTASNFGKVSDLASKSDIALGIINMIFETIGMCSIFASRRFDVKDIILTGNLSTIPQAKTIFSYLNEMFDVRFSIPERSQFGTVIGAALSVTEQI